MKSTVPAFLKRLWVKIAALYDVFGLTRDPQGFLLKRSRSQGDPFTVCFPGVGEVLFTGSTQGVGDVFSASPDVFTPLLPHPVELILGERSLILLGGSRHAHERKLMLQPFHGDRLRVYAAAMRECALESVRAIPVAATVVAQDLGRQISLGIIVGVVFGVQDAKRRADFCKVITTMLDAYSPWLVAYPGLCKAVAVGPWNTFARAREAFVSMLREEVRRGRDEAEKNPEDVFGYLLFARDENGALLSEEGLIDELCTLLVGGHETTAIGLAWVLYYVHALPDVLTKLRQEIATLGASPDPQALFELPYLSAVCNEALRIHPVVPLVTRRVVKPVVVAGRQMAAGQAIAVALTLLHRDPTLYPEPQRFLPERFLEQRFSPFEYAPFGGSTRRCLGAAFATWEMKIVLGTILAHTVFELLPMPRPHAVIKTIAMGPREPIVLRVERHV